ncbi:hypothetical protein HHL16_20395 [Pseudoflavitalea sp. G-6-1-2]|uniref:hypothetical protein n=1 Tax=Pseudoflavitalea sp. G-6-1-2 TaxID=2728841 RepID=UPI00146C2577|nr:hypothetical protein [Pseudoflavitalea sp. G-6-1-2]NML23250.1 hypothetical protein [Pseudoflavitalea sp. G-6-1-2]
MHDGLVHLHSILRWVILVLLIIAIFRHLSGMNNKRPISAQDKKIDLFLMISAHTTFLVGLILWIMGPWGLKTIQTMGMGGVMKNSVFRFFAIEHLVGMLISVVLITAGRSFVKKSSDAGVHKKAFWLFLIALIIILASVPWPFRVVGAGRTWLPGM